MANLYELTDGYTKALSELLEIDGLDDQTFADTMEGLELELEDKLFSTAAYMQNLSADIQPLRDAEDRIKARRITLQNKIDRLKEYVRFNLEQSGIPKIERPEFKMSLRKGVESAFIKDEDSIPENYINMKTLESIDKKKLTKDLKEGVEISGAELKRGKSSLMIK